MRTKTSIMQTIENVRERLEKQFKAVGQMTVEDMIGEVIDLVEDEMGLEYPTWRAFAHNRLLPDFGNPKEFDWFDYFSQPYWGRFEFDIQIGGVWHNQGVTFKIEDPEQFAKIMMRYLPQTAEEWEHFSAIAVWLDVVRMASGWEDLLISNIQIEIDTNSELFG